MLLVRRVDHLLWMVEEKKKVLRRRSRTFCFVIFELSGRTVSLWLEVSVRTTTDQVEV